MTTIAIDYTPAIRQSAGIGRIIRGQVAALLARDLAFDVKLFVVGHVSEDDRARAPLPLHATPISERNMVRLWHRLNSPLPPVEWFTGGKLDLFHATDFVLPPSQARHKIVTVHDLAFLFYPDAAMPSLHRYLHVVVPRSVARSDYILADSQSTADDLQAEWAIPSDKITVVQGAVDHNRFRPIEDTKRQGEVRTKYGIGDRPFILALSTLEPRKNFTRLIQAYAQARREANFEHKLVIGGKKGWLYDTIFEEVQRLKLVDQVILPGFVADEDLPVLYSACEFFAYPSLYEGFGLPILEAMACGTAVLTADNSCLPEAGGDAVLYIDAEDVESIAAGIQCLIDDETVRSDLAQAGQKQAAKFTWARTAAQLLSAYQHVLQR